MSPSPKRTGLVQVNPPDELPVRARVSGICVCHLPMSPTWPQNALSARDRLDHNRPVVPISILSGAPDSSRVLFAKACLSAQ